ncbi:MAG: hypothetical protein GVY14_08690 [Spirochaetes bacterium]|jgi:hypothetical protein|nr:hypothetical protein [Spirochaetota bacterium]
MYQIYLLSVLTNVLAGVALSVGGMDEKLHLSSVFNKELMQNDGFRLGLGIVTFVVGFFKLLSVSEGDVPVVGDILPAISGLVLGMILLLQYYRSRSTVSSPFVDTLDNIFGKNSAVFGTVGILLGILHFLLHRVLFL